MTALNAFAPVLVPGIAMEHEQVEPSAIASGAPATGSVRLADLRQAEIGVWEMTEGGMFDTEVDEIFVVVSGSATVTLLEDDEAPVIVLEPGAVCRLEAGMKTRWDVTEALRKVYIIGSPREGVR